MARILIIEDDDQLRDMLQKMLEREGHNIMAASDGNKAIKLYTETPADLVITDILMPEKEGIETIMELKRDYPGIKIIAISGGGNIGPAGYLDLARKFGADMTLAKPFEREEMIAAVQKLL